MITIMFKNNLLMILGMCDGNQNVECRMWNVIIHKILRILTDEECSSGLRTES